jgi:hypothetical protein
MRVQERADQENPHMTTAPGALAALLAEAKDADPAHRIDWRDPIAAHGAAAIEAVGPWLKDPTLAAFAIRVIARVGLDGEREAAQATLRQARRRLDARLRADADWALGVLRVERPTQVVAAKRTPRTPTRAASARLAGTPRTPARRSQRGLPAS